MRTILQSSQLSDVSEETLRLKIIAHDAAIIDTIYAKSLVPIGNYSRLGRIDFFAVAR